MRVAPFLLWAIINLMILLPENKTLALYLYMLSLVLISSERICTNFYILIYHFSIAIPVALSLQKFREIGNFVDYVYLIFGFIAVVVHIKKHAERA